MGKSFFPVLLCLLLFPLHSQELPVPAAQKGILDLRTWNFKTQGPVPLTGEFVFFWKEFTPSTETTGKIFPIPEYWNTHDPTLPPEGWGTYRLSILLPEEPAVYGLKVPEILTANQVYLNGKLISESGTLGTTPETSKPQYKPHLVFLSRDTGIWNLEIRISNFDYRKSGIWTPLVLGSQERMLTQETITFQIQLLLLGALGIMALYHLGLFYLRPSDHSSLWFSLFCIVVILRLLVTGEHLMTQWFPDFSWEWGRKLEYLPFHLGGLVFMFFLHSLFPLVSKKPPMIILGAGAGIFGLLGLILPTRIMNNLVIPMEIYIGLGLLYFLVILIIALNKKQDGSAQVLLGFGVLGATVINDILYANQIIKSLYLMPLGFFFFIFSQAFLLSRKFSLTFRKVETLSQELLDTNQSLNRFVPNEFLQYLDKKSILDVRLGDQVRKEMTILFSDIRAFTTLSEGMSPEQNFSFLNSYLKRISPLIRRNSGFIDKYVGDAVMALFPGTPTNAVKAGFAMLGTIIEYNQHRANSGYAPITIGIGIHTGSMMLGTIGEEGRMDTTVISDSVNLASRMESLCKDYGQGIIMAKPLFDSLPEKPICIVKNLGEVQVRGKEKVMELVHLSLEG